MTRSRSSSPAPDVFPIYLFVYLFIYPLRLPRHRRRRHRLRLERLFASVANVCLEVGPSAVKHHRFFVEDKTAILSYLESDRIFRSSPEVGDARSWRRQLGHVAIFRYHGADLCSASWAWLRPDSPHLDQFLASQQRSSLGLYHSLHNHLRHPGDRRTTWKEGRRVDLDLALGFSPEQGNG